MLQRAKHTAQSSLPSGRVTPDSKPAPEVRHGNICRHR